MCWHAVMKGPGWGGHTEVLAVQYFGFTVFKMLSVLVNVIVEDSNEGLLECTRVYGNLSRHPPVRMVLARNKGEHSFSVCTHVPVGVCCNTYMYVCVF